MPWRGNWPIDTLNLIAITEYLKINNRPHDTHCERIYGICFPIKKRKSSFKHLFVSVLKIK